VWFYKDKEFVAADAEYQMEQGHIGFVYCITDTRNNKKYIGKKLLCTRRRRPPLKGKKRKRIDIVQTDWQKYYGSSELISEEARANPSSFHREIIMFCRSKGELSYREAELQFSLGVLLSDDYYNSFIGVKLHRAHVKNLRKI
jgi:hypothetical protein